MKYITSLLCLLSLNSSADIATFAGGCFWCTESDFEKHEGISKVISGYAGGLIKGPTYDMVSAGKTKYREGVQVTYDPKVISYQKLLEVFWMHIDPTDSGGQFVDRGLQYSSAIFYHNENQKKLADKSKKMLMASKLFKKSIVTPVEKFTNFYPAEDYHQDFYKKNLQSKIRYKAYRAGSGRDRFIKKNWTKNPFIQKGKTYMKPSKEELKKILTPLQYKVTQQDGTEKPFDNEYWDNKEAGIYIDRVSREPLFSSTHKYKSGTGWPSFWQPIEKDNIVEKEDRKFFSVRTEIRSKHGDSHLGHVFKDGPKPTGLRYCMNSASLIFIPKNKMKEEGFEKYLHLFK